MSNSQCGPLNVHERPDPAGRAAAALGLRIRRFWSEYLALFEQIASEFTSTVINDAGGALEWRSRGRLRNGQDIDYRGVSILEMRNDEVIAFRTYFDTAVFTPHGAKLAASR